MSFTDRLAGASEDRFYEALSELSEHHMEGSEGVALLERVVDQMEGADILRPRDQATRVQTILERLKLDETALELLAERSVGMAPAIRNAIANKLPDHLKASLRPSKQAGATHEGGIVPEKQGASQRPQDQNNNHVLSIPRGQYSNRDDESGRSEKKDATVAILSKRDLQDANKRLLDGKGFGSFVWDTVKKLEDELSHSKDICAFVIDGSFLAKLNEDEQRDLISLIASYSTFTWIRIEEGESLKVTRQDVRKIIRDEWSLSSEVPASRLSFRQDRIIQESELDDVQDVLWPISNHQSVFVRNGKITEEEGEVLTAAICLDAQSSRLDGRRVFVRSYETVFQTAGRSGARVAVINVDGHKRPVVAKIEARDRLRDEIKRFGAYVHHGNYLLEPKIHFRGDTAILLYRLVADYANPGEPAPMLEDRLNALWIKQLHPQPQQDIDATRRNLESESSELKRGIENAILSVSRLNKERPSTLEFKSYANPYTDHIERLEQCVDWGISGDVKAARDKAVEQLKHLQNSAVAHGDIHLRNILLRGNNAYLIDYEATGPGHPAVDLVRLELCLFLKAARLLFSADRCRSYQRALTLDRKTEEQLKEQFDRFHQWHLNDVCTHGCVGARDKALEVLQEHDGNDSDYLAVKYLVAWQSMLMTDVSAFGARAIIELLAEEIMTW